MSSARMFNARGMARRDRAGLTLGPSTIYHHRATEVPFAFARSSQLSNIEPDLQTTSNQEKGVHYQVTSPGTASRLALGAN